MWYGVYPLGTHTTHTHVYRYRAGEEQRVHSACSVGWCAQVVCGGVTWTTTSRWLSNNNNCVVTTVCVWR